MKEKKINVGAYSIWRVVFIVTIILTYLDNVYKSGALSVLTEEWWMHIRKHFVARKPV